MNVTILVGNGFDLNLNLKTKYTDFLSYYCGDSGADHVTIQNFKQDILQDYKTWSDAELAFGRYTEKFLNDDEGAEKFCDCHDDFCVKLASYLQKQETRLNWNYASRDIAHAFGECISFKNLISGLLETEKMGIRESSAHYGGGITYNFINFNYTKSLDDFIEEARKISGAFGERSTVGGLFSNSFGELYHVHGTTENDMVLGVNDESQIQKPEIFENYGDEYKNDLIKQCTNEMNGANMDTKCEKVLKESHLVYIYGMSLGATDALWWGRIVDLLVNHDDGQVIIHAYNAPPSQLLKRTFHTYCRKARKAFSEYYKSDELITDAVLNRIHFDPSNIFEKLKAFAATEETINAVPETV